MTSDVWRDLCAVLSKTASESAQVFEDLSLLRMNHYLLALLVTLLASVEVVSSFVTSPSARFYHKKQTSRTTHQRQQLEMVIYWSIKSSIDAVKYAIDPNTRDFQGTGVWSFIKLKKDNDEEQADEDDSKLEGAAKETAKATSKRQPGK